MTVEVECRSLLGESWCVVLENGRVADLREALSSSGHTNAKLFASGQSLDDDDLPLPVTTGSGKLVVHVAPMLEDEPMTWELGPEWDLPLPRPDSPLSLPDSAMLDAAIHEERQTGPAHKDKDKHSGFGLVVIALMIGLAIPIIVCGVMTRSSARNDPAFGQHPAKPQQLDTPPKKPAAWNAAPPANVTLTVGQALMHVGGFYKKPTLPKRPAVTVPPSPSPFLFAKHSPTLPPAAVPSDSHQPFSFFASTSEPTASEPTASTHVSHRALRWDRILPMGRTVAASLALSVWKPVAQRIIGLLTVLSRLGILPKERCESIVRFIEARDGTGQKGKRAASCPGAR
jgi:hypothetical protein